jgi:hypothetical protein
LQAQERLALSANHRQAQPAVSVQLLGHGRRGDAAPWSAQRSRSVRSFLAPQVAGIIVGIDAIKARLDNVFSPSTKIKR